MRSFSKSTGWILSTLVLVTACDKKDEPKPDTSSATQEQPASKPDLEPAAAERPTESDQAGVKDEGEEAEDEPMDDDTEEDLELDEE